MRRRLARCHNVSDLRALARRRLPRVVFDYLDGGAKDEATLAANRGAFGRRAFSPRVLVDVSKLDLATSVLGRRIELPLVLAPCGLARLIHSHGEIAAARAGPPGGHRLGAVQHGKHEHRGPGRADRRPALVPDLRVARPRPAARLPGARPRLRLQGPVSHGGLPGGGAARPGPARPERPAGREPAHRAGRPARHPRWLWDLLRGPALGLPKVLPGISGDLARMGSLASRSFDPAVTWSDLEWMIAQWDGPFAVKGVLRADDAVRAVQCGAQAVIVSNHGGRQLDHAPATLDVLPEIVDAVGERAEVLVDGGVRRGRDVVKALALGARACLIGRGYLYGLGAAGEAGVDRALELLRQEIARTLALIGCSSLAKLDDSWLRETAQ